MAALTWRDVLTRNANSMSAFFRTVARETQPEPARPSTPATPPMTSTARLTHYRPRLTPARRRRLSKRDPARKIPPGPAGRAWRPPADSRQGHADRRGGR